MIAIDPHTHTVASGHYTCDTLRQVALAAAARGLSAFGNTEHAPGLIGSTTISYFRALHSAERFRYGIRLFFGAELNILDCAGRIDLPEDVMAGLDYCIASLHTPCFRPSDRATNTAALIGAMRNPFVDIIGHPNDCKYPVDLPALVTAAAQTGVLPEINEASLEPGGYRGDNRADTLELLRLCRQKGVSVVFSSDSHGAQHVGIVNRCETLAAEAGFPDELVANRTVERFCSLLRRNRRPR